MKNLQSAVDDQKYQEYIKKRYKLLESDIDKTRREAVGLPDADIVLHYRKLDQYGLKSEEWKNGPLENPEHDFVSPLLDAYLTDLEKRQAHAKGPDASYASLMRK